MKKFTFIFSGLLLIFNISNGQSKREAENAILNSLVTGLQMNPDNPIGINNQLLNNISGSLPDGALKSAIQNYGTNLGQDKDLSYRQIYYDLNTAFDQNPTLLNNSKYQLVEQKLNYIFDSYGALENKLKAASTGNYQFGSFITDPNLISGLTNLSGGSYETAMGIGLGMELLSSMAAAAAEEKRYNKECDKLAKISSETIYAEKDPNLSSALIDAYLGKIQSQIKSGKGNVTPMFRYDFKNGASLQVENGILKYINPQKSIVKNLCPVSPRYDKDKKFEGLDYSNVLVSDNDTYFYLYNDRSKGECKDCLKGNFIIDAETGTIKSDIGMKMYSNPVTTRPKSMSFTDNGVLKTYTDYSAFGFHQILWDVVGLKEKGVTRNVKAKYLYNIKAKRKEGELIVGGVDKNLKQQSEFIFEKDKALGSLFWKNTGKQYWSKLILIDTTGYQNTDLMENELTGMVKDSKNNLYFVSSKGQLGKLNASEYAFNSDKLPNQIRANLKERKVSTYDFINNRNFVAKHGNNFSATMPEQMEALVPIFELTSDNKHLIYIVKDSLFVINPNNLNEVKRFGLGIQPYNSFFTKENGDWVLNIMARNDYAFPVIKKYAIGKLAKMDTRKKSKPQPELVQTVNNNKPQAAMGSVADELKKLKGLLDEGVLTQEEFNEEKKKLLNSGSSVKPQESTTTKPAVQTTDPTDSEIILQPASKTTSKKQTKDISFTIDGKQYCAILAPNQSEFLGLYKYPGKEPCFSANDILYNEPGAPIVKLDDLEEKDLNGLIGKSGKFQTHCSSAYDIWWWLESDCNGNVLVEHYEKADRYILVVEYKAGSRNYPAGTFDRMTLDKFKDGSNKIVILGERIKE